MKWKKKKRRSRVRGVAEKEGFRNQKKLEPVLDY
jgi:hypothetical protein